MPLAIYQLFSKVRELSFLGEVEVFSTNYMYIKLLNDDESINYQVLAIEDVDKRTMIIPQPELSEIQTILMYPDFVEALSKKMMN